jgi:glutamate-1-semialdehyde aminotransferase
VLTQRSHCVTFGGNPVCTAGGHAVLKVLDKEKRQEHCAVVGAHLINRLKELQDKYESNFLTKFHSAIKSMLPFLFRITNIFYSRTSADFHQTSFLSGIEDHLFFNKETLLSHSFCMLLTFCIWIFFYISFLSYCCCNEI